MEKKWWVVLVVVLVLIVGGLWLYENMRGLPTWTMRKCFIVIVLKIVWL